MPNGGQDTSPGMSAAIPRDHRSRPLGPVVARTGDDEFEVISAGPDKMIYTEDEITSADLM